MDGSHRHNVECNYFHKVQKQVNLNYHTGKGVIGFKVVLKQEQNTHGSSYWDESGSLEGERLEGREGDLWKACHELFLHLCDGFMDVFFMIFYDTWTSLFCVFFYMLYFTHKKSLKEQSSHTHTHSRVTVSFLSQPPFTLPPLTLTHLL